MRYLAVFLGLPLNSRWSLKAQRIYIGAKRSNRSTYEPGETQSVCLRN